MTKYNPKEVEEKIRKFWEKENIYKFDIKSNKQVYSIDTPPPYASAGHLHVGHALHYTQFEIIARIMRMLGFNVYFAPGYDDNGLPTEKYVEEKLGIDKSKISRTEFRKLCLEESKRVEEIYTENVFKKLGHSFDWDLLYQTISPEAQKVAQTTFLKLIEKKECYRAKEPTIWCPKHQTALAQAEVEDMERSTKLNYIEFGNNEKLLIATTRPEFLPACVAICIHPEDRRYSSLIGKTIQVPLFEYEVKIIADESVDPDFGTGILMVCTFGDNADIEKWKKYNLDLRIAIDEKGNMTDLADKYAGLSMIEARKKLLEDLKKAGRLKKQEDLEQTVGTCWRCGTPVEYIVKDQWFISALKHKKDLIKMGNKVKWYPEFMKFRYNDWVKGLAWDWAISRQRYYGIPIPVWYCDKCGKTIFPKQSELPLDPLEKTKKCGCGGRGIPEQDVFDTWMTSSNSPEVALRWLEKPEQYKNLAPMSLRPQAHDIIRTWAFYTILKSYLLFNRIPWKDIMIGTFVLDSNGRGMSKSKGNAVWADNLIDKYNVDVFRYWVGTASFGTDLSFKEQELITGQKFLNKFWNASNFVFMNLKDYSPSNKIKLNELDKRFLNDLEIMKKKAMEYFKKYEISKAKKEIEEFFWHDFCDNYLEIIKKRVYNGLGNDKLSAQYTLYNSLYKILQLIAPIMPFITEEIYQSYFKKFEKIKSIHLTQWSKPKINKNLKNLFDFYGVLSEVRQSKSNAKKSMNSEIILTLNSKLKEKLNSMIDDLKNVINASEIRGGNFKVEFLEK